MRKMGVVITQWTLDGALQLGSLPAELRIAAEGLASMQHSTGA